MTALLLHDLRQALRGLFRDFRVSLPAFLTLVLGIGLNVTIFSGVNALLFNALPFADAERLLQLSSVHATTRETQGVSLPDFADWARRSQAFAGMAALRNVRFVVDGPDGPELAEGAAVTGNFFSLLGVEPELGRAFAAAEAGEPGVVLSHRYWLSRFGGDRGVLGRSLRVNGAPRTVIGVLPAGAELPPRALLWTPLPPSADRSDRSLTVIGRVRPGISAAAAGRDLERVGQALAAEHPATNAALGTAVTPLHEALYGRYRTALLLLQVAVLFVLLIACSNVANLLLARGIARRSEILMRATLGASRLQIVRQLLLESLALSLLGGVAGVLLARAAVGPLTTLLPERFPRAGQIAVDGDVLLFAFLLSLATGLLFGVLPALQASRLDLARELHAGYSPGLRRGTGAGRPQRALLVLTLALAVPLLAGTTMLVRSFLALQEVSPGFEARNAYTLRLVLPVESVPDERVAVFYESLLGRLREKPWVAAAGAIQTLPLTGWNPTALLEVAGAGGAAQGVVDTQPVGPGYFAAMRIPVLRGRALTQADATRPPGAVVINETLRRRHFPESNPLGARLRFRRGENAPPSPWLTVAGVVGDVPQFGLHNPPRPEIYYAEWQRSMSLIVLLRDGRPEHVAELRREVLSGTAGLVASPVRGLEEVVRESLFGRRTLTALMAVLAVVALLLAAVGIYGVVSYSVRRRTREIGIRMALGAAPGQVVREVGGQVARLAGIGLGLGLAASLALGQALRSLLYQVTPMGPGTVLPVLLILGLLALLACLGPMRAALRVDPVNALRSP